MYVPTYKVIALFGEAGSGKDSVLKAMKKIRPDLNVVIPCTTRPPREGEIDGVDYHFLTDVQWNKKLFYEEQEFRGWKYGTPKDAFIEYYWNIGIFSIASIKQLSSPKVGYYDKYRIILCPVYLQVPPKERLLRQVNRESDTDLYEVCRRFISDTNDFTNHGLCYWAVDNSNKHTPKETAAYILSNKDNSF